MVPLRRLGRGGGFRPRWLGLGLRLRLGLGLRLRLSTTSTPTASTPPGPDTSVLPLISTCPPSRVRNFVITAHVDAGKSTLSDRLLHRTGNLSLAEIKQGQVLDTLRVERERGITVKAQTATMRWKDHLLNLVDTPGHVDFSWEVKRSLVACQGAVLLVDSTQGVQAQTLANFYLAREAGLTVVPCLTKLDLKTSDPERCLQQMDAVLGIKEDSVIWTSARSGEGVDELLDAVVERVPPPPPTAAAISSESDLFVASVVDLWHDPYKGTVLLIVVRSGRLTARDRVVIQSSSESFEVKEVGCLLPRPTPVEFLGLGRVGYVHSTNVRGAKDAFIGALVTRAGAAGAAAAAVSSNLPTFQKPKPTVFASCYPADDEGYDELKKAVTKLALNDSSVVLKPESSQALGQGYRVGFLGTLHMEVFIQRLEQEFGANVICTAPSVSYVVELREGGKQVVVENSSQLPDVSQIRRIWEPMTQLTVITPVEYVGPLIEALVARRGVQERVDPNFDGARTRLVFRLPWQEAVSNLQGDIKHLSSGFASFDLQEAPHQESDIVRVDLLLNGVRAEPLSFMCHRSKAEARGRVVAQKLQEVIVPAQFEIVIQAAIGSKVVARERIRGIRKNVLEKAGKTVGGGDFTRKQKLLEAQKRGKEKMKSVGSVRLNQEAFLAVLDRGGRHGDGGGDG